MRFDTLRGGVTDRYNAIIRVLGLTRTVGSFSMFWTVYSAKTTASTTATTTNKQYEHKQWDCGSLFANLTKKTIGTFKKQTTWKKPTREQVPQKVQMRQKQKINKKSYYLLVHCTIRQIH